MMFWISFCIACDLWVLSLGGLVTLVYRLVVSVFCWIL